MWRRISFLSHCQKVRLDGAQSKIGGTGTALGLAICPSKLSTEKTGIVEFFNVAVIVELLRCSPRRVLPLRHLERFYNDCAADVGSGGYLGNTRAVTFLQHLAIGQSGKLTDYL